MPKTLVRLWAATLLAACLLACGGRGAESPRPDHVTCLDEQAWVLSAHVFIPY